MLNSKHKIILTYLLIINVNFIILILFIFFFQELNPYQTIFKKFLQVDNFYFFH